MYLHPSCFDLSVDQHSFLGIVCPACVFALLPVLLQTMVDPVWDIMDIISVRNYIFLTFSQIPQLRFCETYIVLWGRNGDQGWDWGKKDLLYTESYSQPLACEYLTYCSFNYSCLWHEIVCNFADTWKWFFWICIISIRVNCAANKCIYLIERSKL